VLLTECAVVGGMTQTIDCYHNITTAFCGCQGEQVEAAVVRY